MVINRKKDSDKTLGTQGDGSSISEPNKIGASTSVVGLRFLASKSYGAVHHLGPQDSAFSGATEDG